MQAAVRGSAQVALWAREAYGMDGLDSPALLTFFYLAAPRGGARMAGALCQALQARWGAHAVQLEGAHPPDGSEVLVWEGPV